MSSDLLSAFGPPESKSRSQVGGQAAGCRVDPEDEEDDDFGDFEDVQKDFEDNGVQDESKDLKARSSETLPISKALIDEHKGWAQPSRQSNLPPSSHDDDWGDFASQEIMFDADQSDKGLTPVPKKLSKKQPTYAPVEMLSFDASDSWEPVNVAQAPITLNQRSSAATVVKSGMDVPTSQAPTPAMKKDPGPPPTNVPPPSVLLTVITNIFQNLSSKIKEIVTQDRASSDLYEALDEPRIALLQKQMSTIRSSARIMAGRKLRWKRDAILSQSMRIGPAGQSGMKLSSVDKNETRREDQEISEAVHIWKKQIGPLRSTVAKVNVHLPGEGLMIPDISDILPVRQGKPSEGAVKAPKCCFLCGINRDERVAKVDIWVEDTFGEWWIDHWGHFDCVEFWHSEKEKLAQR